MPEKNQPKPGKQRIAIAGATGRVGSALTKLLASDPVDVVALSRRPDAAGLPTGVTVAAIDFDQPKTLENVLRELIASSSPTERHPSRSPTRSP